MQRAALIMVGLLAIFGMSRLPAREGRALSLAGRQWLPYAEALQLSARQQKPLLLVQMLGDLDEAWC